MHIAYTIIANIGKTILSFQILLICFNPESYLKSLNSDGKHFHQYQQSKQHQSQLNPLNMKKDHNL